MNEVILSNGNQIEFHYFLENNSHSMDAKILHDCNGEVLGTIRSIADLLDISYIIETVAISEGGLKQVFKLTDKRTARISLLVALITLLFTIFPPEKRLSDLEKRNIELQNQKLELEIDQLKKANEGDVLREKTVENINQYHDVVIPRSHYYERLARYDKIDKVTYSILDENNAVLDVFVVEKDSFIYFIKEEEKAPETVDENAQIFLIAPILVDIKYKWKGLYNGVEIDFFMNDSKFRDEIEHRDVSFQAGTLLVCKLVTRKKIDESGLEKITSFAVENVYQISTTSGNILTISGKIKAKNEKDEKSQGKLEFEE